MENRQYWIIAGIAFLHLCVTGLFFVMGIDLSGSCMDMGVCHRSPFQQVAEGVMLFPIALPMGYLASLADQAGNGVGAVVVGGLSVPVNSLFCATVGYKFYLYIQRRRLALRMPVQQSET